MYSIGRLLILALDTIENGAVLNPVRICSIHKRCIKRINNIDAWATMDLKYNRIGSHYI